MPPGIDQAKRAAILAGIIEYIAEQGLSDLSLRPLAASLGTSARMLMHYFGSKEQLLVAALEAQRPRINESFAHLKNAEELQRELYAGWVANTTGDSATSTRVVLQVLGDACVQQGPFRDYANTAVTALVDALAKCLARLNTSVDDPRAAATLLVSGLRGLILDRFVTGDVARTDRAALLLINQAIPVTKTQ